MKTLGRSTLIFSTLILVAGCASRPKLYPNEKFEAVGPTKAEADVDSCIQMADEYLKGEKAKQIGRSAGSGAVMGGVIGGIFSGVIRGIEWVTQNHQGPSVVNMSLGGGVSQAMDTAIENSIASGVVYVVAAGNEDSDACLSSPSRVSGALTVGSSTRFDVRSSFSNFGSCVDIFAPGSDIISAWFNSNTASNTISGTSMASPHVAGVAARYLISHPSSSPAQVHEAIVSHANLNKLSSVGSGSPNRLLSTLFLSNFENPPGEDPIDPPLDPPGGVVPPGVPFVDLQENQVISS